MDLRKTTFTLTLFLVGFLLGWMFDVSSTHLSYPHLLLSSPTPTHSSAVEQFSPSDLLTTDDVKVYKDFARIEGDFLWTEFTDTNSMDPVFDAGSQALQKKPENADQLSVGDIISFNANQQYPIVHRIVAINEDEQGWYATTQGDNIAQPDPIKVRFSDVIGVVAVVIY